MAIASVSSPADRQGRGAARAQLLHRWRQLQWLARHEGVSGVSRRLRTRLAGAMGTRPAWPVHPADVLGADLDRRFVPPVLPVIAGEPLWLNWVMAGPSVGSGGHTTVFRMVRHLEAHGYRNRIYLYDPALTDDRHYADIIRDHYGFSGPVARLDGAMQDAHGVIATAWPSAYAVYNARCAGKRFYFVQDLEPEFYPAGVERILAENTYRMGFYGITAGRWLSGELLARYRMDADHFDFGCDTSRYRNQGGRRNGIIYYARPSTPRRGFELGVLALQVFAARRPDIDIHLYGERVGRLPFRFVDHGLVSPDQLNALYNQCHAGLSLSLTNVSLVPLEMLAAGCIPVVNDAPHNRRVLDNPQVRYAEATPAALAGALEDVVASPASSLLAQSASEGVRTASWSEAGANVDAIIRRLVVPS
jgi:glycosyltransferase involved in cell wall biosynthesis